MVIEGGKYKKFPRTPHLPWSEGATEDDKTLSSVEHFRGHKVIVTEKLDGENTTMYNDHVHARSINSKAHWSRAWVKNKWSKVRHMIPSNVRVCGENMYAVHSIVYTDLPSYFIGFAIFEDDICLEWSATVDFLERLDISPPPVFFEGMFDEEMIRSILTEADYETCEGYVVRLQEPFHYNNFADSVAKFVRPNHVQTDDHWMRTGNEVNMLQVSKG